MRFMKLDIPGNGMMFSMTSSHGWLMGWFIIWFTALAYNTSGIYIYVCYIYICMYTYSRYKRKVEYVFAVNNGYFSITSISREYW